MKKLLLLLFTCLAISWQAHAQFQYSVKAGCSWLNIKQGDNEWRLLKKKASFTLGANVDYTFKNFGIQSGIGFQQIRNDERSIELGGEVYEFLNTASYLNIPLLATIRTAQHPKVFNLIIGVGPFINIHLGDSRDYYKHDDTYGRQTYYGIVATAQLEFYAHYFLRAEQQWALKTDRKVWEDTRTNIFSLVAGYKF